MVGATPTRVEPRHELIDHQYTRLAPSPIPNVPSPTPSTPPTLIDESNALNESLDSSKALDLDMQDIAAIDFDNTDDVLNLLDQWLGDCGIESQVNLDPMDLLDQCLPQSDTSSWSLSPRSHDDFSDSDTAVMNDDFTELFPGLFS